MKCPYYESRAVVVVLMVVRLRFKRRAGVCRRVGFKIEESNKPGTQDIQKC